MGFDARILVRVDRAKRDAAKAAMRAEGLAPEEDGDWLYAPIDDMNEEVAASLSRLLEAPTVLFSIETGVEQIWILAFDAGTRVRELRYSADEGWATDEGRPCAFENHAALSKWKARARVSASPEGYDVLEAFLGRG